MDSLTLGSAVAPHRGDLMASRISRMDRNSAKDEPEMVAQEIESLFATLLVSEMRKGLGEGFFGSGAGSDTFSGWFDEEIGAAISARGSLGLAKTVHEALIREQAAADEEALRNATEDETGVDA